MSQTILIATCVYFTVNGYYSRRLLDAPYFLAGSNYNTWADAKEACESQNRRLATFHSEADIAAMADKCAEGVCDSCSCYTGWSDDDRDGVYSFVTGETMDPLNAWGPDEPHNEDNHYCGCVDSQNDQKIFDCICDVTNVNTLPIGAVCEEATVPSPTIGDIVNPPGNTAQPTIGDIVNPPSPTIGCACLYYFDGCNYCTCDPATGMSTCTAMHCDPWGDYECLDAESNCTAKVCAHGDNRIHLDISYDSGSSWNLFVESEADWKNTMTHIVTGVDEDTILRFTVTDSGGVGGFLCTVQLCGENGYIFNFYTDESNTYFDVISDSLGDPLVDVFNAFGAGLWAAHVNPNEVMCMSEEADWIWNDKTYNTMVFELNFAHHLDILQRLECIETTPAPTQQDCCAAFESVDDYLGQCYCNEPVCECLHYFDGCNECWCDPDSGLSLCSEMFCDPWGEYECWDHLDLLSNAESIGKHIMDDEKSNDDGTQFKFKEKMKDIKDMIYATWLIIFVCFVTSLTINALRGRLPNGKDARRVYYK